MGAFVPLALRDVGGEVEGVKGDAQRLAHRRDRVERRKDRRDRGGGADRREEERPLTRGQGGDEEPPDVVGVAPVHGGDQRDRQVERLAGGEGVGAAALVDVQRTPDDDVVGRDGGDGGHADSGAPSAARGVVSDGLVSGGVTPGPTPTGASPSESVSACY